jgi:alkyl hydroperoxide reductase subunit AhpC
MDRKEGGIGPNLDLPLIADPSHEISKKYGVLIDGSGISLRGLFIIDKELIVRHITINDLPVGRSVDEVLRVIKAFQFNEKHGEVCPANWKSGDKTIVPDPNKSKDFFKGVQ